MADPITRVAGEFVGGVSGGGSDGDAAEMEQILDQAIAGVANFLGGMMISELGGSKDDEQFIPKDY